VQGYLLICCTVLKGEVISFFLSVINCEVIG
jgi:hypothetical protein